MKKLLAWVMGLMILLTVPVCADTSQTSVQKETIDIGSYSVWRHSDGVTWQNGLHPGSNVTHNPTIAVPTDDSKNPQNFTVEFLSTQYSVDGKAYEGVFYNYGVTSGTVSSFKYLGGGNLTYSLNTALVDHSGQGGMDVTKDWQNQLVTGRMFYIPVKITWTESAAQGTGNSGIVVVNSIGSPVQWIYSMTTHSDGTSEEHYYIWNTITHEQFEYFGTEGSQIYDREMKKLKDEGKIKPYVSPYKQP